MRDDGGSSVETAPTTRQQELSATAAAGGTWYGTNGTNATA